MKKRWEVQRQFRQSNLNDKFVDFINFSKESEKNMSLNFAITLIVAIITVLYHSFNYLNNNSIEPHLFEVYCYLFSVGVIILLLVLTFIYLRGISIELKSTEFKNNINSISSICFKLSFLIFPVFLIFFLSMYIGESFDKFTQFPLIGGLLIPFISSVVVKLGYNETFKLHLKYKTKYLSGITILACLILYIINRDYLIFFPRMLLVVSVFAFIRFLTRKETIKFENIYSYISIISILLILNTSPFVSMALISQSHIEMQMVDTHAGNESRIYGNLHVFGLNENVSLSLEKIDSNEGMIEVEAITLEPVNNSISSDTIILSNYLNDGEYFISLNMSNQSSGYYKLSTDTGDSRKQANKVFFLE